MGKVILIVCDALRDDTAAQQMGYLEHLVEEKRASRYHCIAGLPTLSRPLYETLHTGMHASDHGITSNETVRRSTMPNLFQLARDAGKTTAAAAYSWYSELYVRAPYDLVDDRELDDTSAAIQHGRFYSDDNYPDMELFATGGLLVKRFIPDYLLIHPMGLDTIGHLHGGNSREYRAQVIIQDQIMANLIPLCLQVGYTILVTGDHGMDEHRQHNGTAAEVRQVPLYVVAADGAGKGNTRETVSQLQVAPTVCQLLGITPASTMKMPSVLTR